MSDLNVIRSDEDRKDIVRDLIAEYQLAEEERQTFLMRVDKWRRQREARPESDTKDYPFKDASNVSVPVTGSSVNTIFASMKASMSKKRPLIDVIAVDQYHDGRAAGVLQAFLDRLFESRNYINVRPANNIILYENISLGTQFVKVPWETEKWNFKRRDRSTGALVAVSRTVRDTPAVIPMRLEDYLTRMHFVNPQTAPWYATITHLFEHELKQRSALGIYNQDAVDRVIKAPRTQLTVTENLEAVRHGLSTSGVKVYDIHETHYFYDVDDDGFAEDIMLWVHPQTAEVLREDFNDLGKRDIVRMTYMEMPYALYGMGIGWMSEHMQDEVDTLHNAAIDSTHFSILPMLVARRGSGIGPKEEFFPGKVLIVDDVKDAIPIKFADVSQGTVSREYLAREYVQRFTGSTDYMAGQESSAIRTRATVGGTMFLAQQGNKLFEAITENTNKAFGEIAELVLYQLVRNRDVVRTTMMNLVPEDDRVVLDQILDIEPEDIPQRFVFNLKTTDPEQTESAKREGILTLTSLYMQFGQQMSNVYNMAFNQQLPVPPQVRELMVKFIVGGTKMIDRILQDFGYDDTRPFIPDVRTLELMNEFKEAQTTAQLEAMKHASRGPERVGRANVGELVERPSGTGGPPQGMGESGEPMAGEPADFE